jgi:hypothetical protein
VTGRTLTSVDSADRPARAARGAVTCKGGGDRRLAGGPRPPDQVGQHRRATRRLGGDRHRP